MARLNWQGSMWNNASITDIYLEDSLGQTYGLLNSIGGDITFTPAKVGRFSSKVRGFVQSRLQGEVEDGSISIPLKMRAPTATFGSAQPSPMDILAQNSLGTAYVPFSSISVPANGSFAARTIYSDPLVKSWKLVIELSTSPIDGAPYTARCTTYPMIPTPDQTMANVGADSTVTIAGVIDDPNLGLWDVP